MHAYPLRGRIVGQWQCDKARMLKIVGRFHCATDSLALVCPVEASNQNRRCYYTLQQALILVQKCCRNKKLYLSIRLASGIKAAKNGVLRTGALRGLSSDIHVPPRALFGATTKLIAASLKCNKNHHYQNMSDRHAVSHMPPPALATLCATRGAETLRVPRPSISAYRDNFCPLKNIEGSAPTVRRIDLQGQRQSRLFVFCVTSLGKCLGLQTL